MKNLRRLLRVFLLLSASVCAASPSSASTRQAVLVGVGKYHPETVDRSDLEGPPNDIVLMRSVLASYGFEEKNVTVLVDEQATRRAIMEAVENELLAQEKNSLAVFYFSGHGSSLRSKNEIGEFNDETIVPYDARVRGKPVADIIDDEIYAWIREFDRRGIQAVLIFDSCMSGGISRPGVEVRRMPAIEIGRRVKTDPVLSFRQPDSLGRRTPIVVLTASEASDLAYSKKDGVTGQMRGVFTSAVSSLLSPSGPTLPPATWRGVSDTARNQVMLQGELPGAQKPQFYGSLDSQVFAGNAEFSYSIKAHRTDANLARLELGAAFGITPGSIFKLFTQTQVPWRLSEQFAALARVTRVTDDSAEMAIERGHLDQDEYRAVEYEYAIPNFNISLKNPAGTIKDKTDAKAIQDVIDAVQTKSGNTGGGSELIITATPNELHLATEDGRVVGSPIPRTDSVSVGDALRGEVAAYVRWQRLFAWRRPSVHWRGVSYRIEYIVEGQRKLLSGADLQNARIPAGATISLAVSNTGSQPVNAIGILLRPDFGIDVCPAGQVRRNKENATEQIKLGVRTGRAAWKLIVADPTQPIELEFLKSGSNSRSAGGNSLDSEMAALWNGAVLQSRRGSGPAQSNWQAFDIPFEVVNVSDGDVAGEVGECLGFPEK